MDLTRQLGQAGFTPERINAVVGIILEKRPTGWTTTMGQLDVLARVAGATQGDFIQAAQNAKKNCPISTIESHPLHERASHSLKLSCRKKQVLADTELMDL